MERNLRKIKANSKKRVGRGYGSGKGGHTAGRGQKGQKTRRKVGVLFEGIKVRKSLLKRTPQLRGKTKFASRSNMLVVKTGDLKKVKGTKIDVKTLIENGLVSKKALKFGVKIVSGGKVEKKFEVDVPVTKSAKKLIEKAGGKTS